MNDGAIISIGGEQKERMMQILQKDVEVSSTQTLISNAGVLSHGPDIQTLIYIHTSGMRKCTRFLTCGSKNLVRWTKLVAPSPIRPMIILQTTEIISSQVQLFTVIEVIDGNCANCLLPLNSVGYDKSWKKFLCHSLERKKKQEKT